MKSPKASFMAENIGWVRPNFSLSVESLQITPGECLAVMGASGSGKSSLLLALSGFLPQSQAKVFTGEENLSALPPERRRIALLFQKSSLFVHLNVWQNVAFGLKVKGLPEAERREKALSWLAKVGLSSHAERSCQGLSGGEAQRVALARAMAVEFPVLFLDEPFGALDPALKQELRLLVKQLIQETQTAALLVTHEWKDTHSLAEKVMFLDKGRVHFSGKVSDAEGSRDPLVKAIVQG